MAGLRLLLEPGQTADQAGRPPSASGPTPTRPSTPSHGEPAKDGPSEHRRRPSSSNAATAISAIVWCLPQRRDSTWQRASAALRRSPPGRMSTATACPCSRAATRIPSAPSTAGESGPGHNGFSTAGMASTGSPITACSAQLNANLRLLASRSLGWDEEGWPVSLPRLRGRGSGRREVLAEVLGVCRVVGFAWGCRVVRVRPLSPQPQDPNLQLPQYPSTSKTPIPPPPHTPPLIAGLLTYGCWLGAEFIWRRVGERAEEMA